MTKLLTLGGDSRSTILGGLAADGYAVVPNYFSAALVRALRLEAQHREKVGEFHDAAIGRSELHHHNDFVRRDRTLWLDGSTLAQCQLQQELETLRLEINRDLFLGLFDLESHFAIYDPGAFYRRHLDAFNGNNQRVVSVVIYLNEAWQCSDGGRLRIWPEPDSVHSVLDVAPRAGTLVCFLSERIPHEVLAAQRERFSIAGWFRRNNSSALCIDPPR